MKDVTRTFIATGIIQLVNILSGVMLARILLAEGRGELAAAMLWPGMIASFGILGIHEAVMFHASRRSGKGDAILSSSLVLSAALSVVAAVIAFVVIDLALVGYPAEVMTAARLYIAFIPLNFIGLCMIGLFQGSMRLNEWNVLRVLVHVAYTGLIGLFYLAGWATVTGLVAAALLSNALMIATAAIFMIRHGWLRPARPALTRELFSFGAKIHAGAVVQALTERADQLFISVAIGSTGLGLYVVATTVSRLTAVPAVTLASLVFAKVANASDMEDQRDILGRYLRATLVLVLGAAVVVIAFGQWVLSIFFGPSFDAALDLVRLLAVASLFLGVKTVLAAGLKGMGRPLVVARSEAAGLGFTILGLAVLMPIYGLTGAAIAAVLAQAAGLMVMAVLGRRVMGGSWRGLLRPTARDGEIILGLVTFWRGAKVEQEKSGDGQ